MTVTAPDYTAEIVATPNIPVSMRNDSGRIVLDSARAPHVEATVTLSVEDPTMLVDLDPRNNRRLQIEAGGRLFDLGIREANPNRGAGTVELQLASDEALLDDFAQLVDDKGARAHEASLRGVVDYVLDKIDATLEPGTADANVTAYWAVTNMLFNPGGKVNASHWSNGGQTTVTRGGGIGQDGTAGYIVGTATGTAGAIYAVDIAQYNLSATPGKRYVFSVYIRTTRACQVRPRIYFLDAANQQVAFIDVPDWINVPVSAAWVRVDVSGTAPASAAKIAPFVTYQGMIAGQQLLFSSGMLYEGDELIPAFNGATPAGGGYTYEWAGAAHASASNRIPVAERRPESLVWPAGTSALTFLAPLVQASGFRLVCNERREWTLRPAEYREPGTLSYRFGVNIAQADEELSRSSEEWFDGAVYRYTWTDSDGIEQERIDAWATSASPSKIILREISAPYPGAGRAQYAVTRAQGRGRTVEVRPGVPTWQEAAEQELAIILDGTGVQSGISNRVEFDIGGNAVTVTSRTTDIPAGAIDLLPGTINALPGTINSL